MKRLGRAIRYRWLKVLRLKDSPVRVARGVACGVAAGAFPPMGQMVLAWFFALGLRGNIVAAVLATWWSNPFTYVPIYYLFYRFGLLFVDVNQLVFPVFAERIRELDGLDSCLSLGHDVFLPMMTGCILGACILGPLTYQLTYRALIRRKCVKRDAEVKA